MDNALYPYEEIGVDTLVQKRRFILADDAGLGKNVQASAALSRIEFDTGLILCPKLPSASFLLKLDKWFGQRPTYIKGKPKDRIDMWKEPFVMANYELLMRDLPLVRKKWDVIITDEAHKYRNRRSKKYKSIRPLRSEYLWELTATPVRRGPQDLYTLLNLIDPVRFSSYWKFVNRYCYVLRNPFGGHEVQGVKNIDELRRLLKGYLLKRRIKDVLPDLPSKTRERILIEMDDSQRSIYMQLAADMISEMPSGDILVTPGVLGQLVRFRQLLACPKILDPDLTYGAALEAIAETLEDSNDEDRHVVVFTPFTAAFPFIEERLKQYGPIFKIKGQMQPDDVLKAAEDWKAAKGIMIASILAAESYDLETAQYAHMLGYEWDYDTNEQAEGRLYRAITKNPVFIYYYQYQGTVDDRVLEVVNFKHQTVTDMFEEPVDVKNFLLGDS